MSKRKIRRPRREYSDKQIERIKKVNRLVGAKDALVISIAVMADELELTDEQIGKIAMRFDRYIRYKEDDLIRMRAIMEIIERETGITFGNE